MSQTRCLIIAVFIAPVCGCRYLPPNYLALNTAERAAPHPALLNFTHGAAWTDPDNGLGVTVLAGKGVLLRFDHAGPGNRVQLLFHRGGSRALYERVGQREHQSTEAASTSQVGIKTVLRGQQLRGSIDVFVSVSEREGLDVSAAYERYPRVMRLIGYFAVPFGEPSSPGLSAALTSTNSDSDPAAWTDDLVGRRWETLPKLPVVDVKYLVPTTLVDRLIDRP